MFGKKKRIKKQWSNNLGEEQDFWRSLAGKTNKANPEWNENFHRRAKELYEFPADFEQYLPPEQVEIKALDVGAGPFTQLGSKHEWRTIDILPIDPLAEYYNDLIDEFNVESVHPRTVACDGEALTQMFAENSFDFVYSRNALDHSYDPVAAIQEIVKVLKPGCSFYMTCYINEGEGGNYQGLHQWNFDLAEESDDFVVWNKSQRTNLKNALPKHVTVKAGHGQNNDWMFASVTKNA